MILQRHVVDVARVERRDDRRLGHVAELARSSRARLSGSGFSQRHSRTSGWTPRLAISRTLCWVGLVLSSPAAAIHGTKVVWTLTVWSRPRSLRSWRIASMNGRLSMSPTVPPISQMTKSSAVDVVEREFLDRVGDVGDDLDGRAEIIAAPFLGDDVAVDAAGGDIVRLARRNAGEALVMAKVEVGLRAVVGDVDLAVLIGAHRPRIDVEIGIELADPDLEAARLQQRPERCREQTFTKR